MEDDTINTSQPVIKFNEHFWGEKFNGWEVLYKNLRSSLASVKEFEQYLRESATTEDAYVKNLDKIKFQILKFASDSSISPIWHNILKELNHSNSSSHLHFKYRIEELIKEIQNYHDDLRKKKQKIKENETKTLQLVELIRTLSANLAKSKEMFFQANLEVEKQLVEVNQTSSPSLAAQITLQKLERKCQSLKDEYLNSIEKFNSTRVEYEQKFTESCNLFQHEEELHLKKMRKFILNYAQLVAQLNSSRQKNFNDCQQQLNNVYTNEMLLQQLIVSKTTGQDRPMEAMYVEPNFESADLALRSSTRTSISSQNIHRSPTLLDSSDATTEELKVNPDYDSTTLYSSSVPNSTNTPKQTIKLNPKTAEFKKKPDAKTFNILDMFGRSTKSTKSEIISGSNNNSKKSKPNESLSKSSLSSSYSFLPNFLLSTSSKEESKLGDCETTISSKKAVEAVTDTFDKQLKQIDTFEQEKIKHTIRPSSTDPMDIKFISFKSDDEAKSPSKNSSKIVKKGIRFEMDESPPSDHATSPINLIKKRDDKPSVGSLMTATSLDNAMFDNTGLFDNLEDYVDSVNSNSVVSNTGFANKMNEVSNINHGSIYAFSESSDDEPNEETNKTITTISQQIYSKPIPPDEIEENTDENSNDTDNDSDDSDAPKKVFIKIRPLRDADVATSPEVLREISKNLQLRPHSSFMPRRQISSVQKNELFQTPATQSFTSISSINNILPSSSPSFSSDREAASRSQSAIDNQLAKLDENNNNLNTNIVFQMDKPPMEAPPLPPLPPNLKQKYHDIINPQHNKINSLNSNPSNNSQTLTQLKSDSSLENLNYDCLSDLSMNNSPITNVTDDQAFAKF